MRNIFLTSDIGAQRKINGKKVICATDNTYGLVDQIKSVLKAGNFVFIASSPDAHEINEMYAENVAKSLRMAGVPLEKEIVVDDRNADKIVEILKNASFVFLAGGYPPSQIDFIQKFGIDKALQNFDGVVVGQSAGAMNLSKLVYNYPEEIEEIGDKKFWEGIGLADITIIPHFDLEEGNPGVEGIDLINDYFLPDSHKCTLYGIPNGSHVWFKNGKPEFFGHCYMLKNGKILDLKKTIDLEK